jgi:hypothetical protein
MTDYRDDSTPGRFTTAEDEELEGDRRLAVHGTPTRLTDEQAATLRACHARRRQEQLDAMAARRAEKENH